VVCRRDGKLLGSQIVHLQLWLSFPEEIKYCGYDDFYRSQPGRSLMNRTPNVVKITASCACERWLAASLLMFANGHDECRGATVWPKSHRIVVAFATGVRPILTPGFMQAAHRQVWVPAIVENKPGAGAIIAIETVASRRRMATRCS
jgi:hypothetical protein